MNETNQMLRAIIERLDVQSGQLNAISMDVHHMKGEITELKSDMAIVKSDVAELKSDVAELKKGQRRQEKILESLAVRSLEKETDIRELRRAK